MIPSCLLSTFDQVDEWELDDVDGNRATFTDGDNTVWVYKRGMGDYTVTLQTHHATIEEQSLGTNVATATAIGFMQAPGLFEQRKLEAVGVDA